jgi:transcriptional regulator with XRE-family HTH domain
VCCVCVHKEPERADKAAQFWSRGELAKASGIHRDHIGRLERGYEGESRPPTIRKLAQALGVDPAELVE